MEVPSVPVPPRVPPGGDKVGGDKVGGDKVGGDKVGGDKISVTGGQGTLINPTGPVSQTNVQTDGGDYAGRDLDKRRGIFFDRTRFPLAVVTVVIVVFVGANVITAGAAFGGFQGRLQAWDLWPSFPSEHPGETLIVVVPFFRTQGVLDSDAAHVIAGKIQESLPPALANNVRVAVAEGKSLRGKDQDGAKALGQRYNASMIIWGSDTGVQVAVSYLNLRQPNFKAANVQLVDALKALGVTQ